MFQVPSSRYSLHNLDYPDSAENGDKQRPQIIPKRVFSLDCSLPRDQLVAFDGEGSLSILPINLLQKKLQSESSFQILGPEEIGKFNLMTLLLNGEDFELFALYSLKGEFKDEFSARSPYFLMYYNMETEFRFRYDLKFICPESKFGSNQWFMLLRCATTTTKSYYFWEQWILFH